MSVQLRRIISIKNSNVDKISNASEIPVRLCNYVDVYKNDRITTDLEFMSGTATQDEISRFGLKIGDVLITKDSEDRNDIGVPAYVHETSSDLVCGYHLSLLRANTTQVNGNFLFWALKSKESQEQFTNAANGVTRYGLTLDGIKSLSIPLPAVKDQESICAFLNEEITKIDSLITKKETFICLVQEKKLSLANQLLNGAIINLDSSGEQSWFGSLPSSWKTKRAKFLFKEAHGRSETGDEELLTVSHITGVTKRSEKDVNMFMAETMEGYKLVAKSDVIINTMWAWMGAMGVSPHDGLISPSYGVYRPLKKYYEDEYLDLIIRSKAFIAEATRRSKGIHSSRLRLYPDAFLDILFPVPSLEEQTKILSEYKKTTSKENKLVELNTKSIELLKQFRTSLITEAVTGQLDIKAWKKKGGADKRLDNIEEAMAS